MVDYVPRHFKQSSYTMSLCLMFPLVLTLTWGVCLIYVRVMILTEGCVDTSYHIGDNPLHPSCGKNWGDCHASGATQFYEKLPNSALCSGEVNPEVLNSYLFLCWYNRTSGVSEFIITLMERGRGEEPVIGTRDMYRNQQPFPPDKLTHSTVG